MKRFLIIADDITGANDTGVNLVRCGISTTVTMGHSNNGFDTPQAMAQSHNESSEIDTQSAASYVINTDSRALPPHEAYVLIKALPLHFCGFDYVVKKVDSTLRGSIAHEILAVDELYNPGLIIFQPALPDLGRTTQDGIHLLNGIPISETEIGQDPKTPVHEHNLKKVLQAAYNESITHLDIKDIEEGRTNFDTGRIFTCDASTNRHMQAVVAAASKTGKRILWVGSAGIVDSLVQTLHHAPPALAVVASVSETTRRQVRYAQNKGVPLVIIPSQVLVSGGYDAYVNEALALLESGQDVIVLPSSSYNRDEEKDAANSIKIQDSIGEVAAAILQKVEISGIFLSGGDTAMGFFGKVDAGRFNIIAEVLQGIPLMQVIGGKHGGMKVITKAGAFGEQDALYYCLRKLKEKLVHVQICDTIKQQL